MFGYNTFSTVVGFHSDGSTDISQSHYNVQGDWVAISSDGTTGFHPYGQDLVTGESNPAPDTTSSSDPLANATFEPGSKVKCHDEECPPNHHAMTVIDGKGDEKSECMPNDAPHTTETEKKSFWEWLFGTKEATKTNNL